MQRVVLHTATGSVKRYGYADFAGDGSFDAATETVLAEGTDYQGDRAFDGGLWSWNGSDFVKNALLTAKNTKITAIDARTQVLIARGFEFPPASGQRFSLSDNAQRTLLGADAQRNDPAFTYPVAWNTKDDDGVLSIPDSATLHNFVLSAVGAVRAHLDSGTALKDQVRAATTVVEVEAVVDTR